jgi:hypothetical protein
MEKRPFLPLPLSSSSAFTLPSRAAGTEPALLLVDFAMSLSFWLMTTFGLGPGLSAAMLSRSSRLSVTLRLPCRSRDLPTLVARDADVGVSSELLSADRIPSCVEMSLPPSSDFSRPTISLSSLMISRKFVSSSSSILSDGAAPRANRAFCCASKSRIFLRTPSDCACRPRQRSDSGEILEDLHGQACEMQFLF